MEDTEEYGENFELIESEDEDVVMDSGSEGEMTGEPVEDEAEEGVALDRMLHDMVVHGGEPVYSLDVHPSDETLLVTGGGDDCARLVRYEHMTEEYQVVAELGPNSDSVIAVKFSHDGKYVASGGMDGSVRIFDGRTGAPVHVFDGPNEVVWIDWHPKGQVIAAGAEDGLVWMWNVEKGECMQVFSGNSTHSFAGMFSPDGRWLVSTGEGIVFVWNPKEGRAELTYDARQGHLVPEGDLVSLAINPGSMLIAVGAVEGAPVTLLHLTHHQIVAHLDGHTEGVEGLAFSPKHNYLVTAGLDGRVLMWDVNSFQIRAQCQGESSEDGVTMVRWVSDPDTFVTTSVSGLVSVWDGRSGERLDQFGLQEAPCLGVAPIPSKNLMFCAYENGRVVSFAYN